MPYARFVVFTGPAVTMAYSDDGTVMLQLLNTVVEQSGEYICTASNESGVATSTAILTVTGTCLAVTVLYYDGLFILTVALRL